MSDVSTLVIGLVVVGGAIAVVAFVATTGWPQTATEQQSARRARTGEVGRHLGEWVERCLRRLLQGTGSAWQAGKKWATRAWGAGTGMVQSWSKGGQQGDEAQPRRQPAGEEGANPGAGAGAGAGASRRTGDMPPAADDWRTRLREGWRARRPEWSQAAASATAATAAAELTDTTKTTRASETPPAPAPGAPAQAAAPTESAARAETAAPTAPPQPAPAEPVPAPVASSDDAATAIPTAEDGHRRSGKPVPAPTAPPKTKRSRRTTTAAAIEAAGSTATVFDLTAPAPTPDGPPAPEPAALAVHHQRPTPRAVRGEAGVSAIGNASRSAPAADRVRLFEGPLPPEQVVVPLKWWQRVRSGVALFFLVALLGAIAAALIGGGVAVVALFLQDAVGS